MLWYSTCILVIQGLGFVLLIPVSNTIIQTIVDEDKRGRIMSFYMVAFLGTYPFGSLIAVGCRRASARPHTLLVGGLLPGRGKYWFATELPIITE